MTSCLCDRQVVWVIELKKPCIVCVTDSNRFRLVCGELASKSFTVYHRQWNAVNWLVSMCLQRSGVVWFCRQWEPVLGAGWVAQTWWAQWPWAQCSAPAVSLSWLRSWGEARRSRYSHTCRYSGRKWERVEWLRWYDCSGFIWGGGDLINTLRSSL